MRIREIFWAVALGLLLLVIGIGTESKGVVLAGVFILPLAFLWGALIEKEQSTPVRITFMAIAGILLTVTIQAFFGTSLRLPF